MLVDDPSPLLQPWLDALGPGAAEPGRDVVARYAEPQRRYHDRRHLAEVLAALRLLSDGRAPVPVVLAAYFHDAVYDPRGSGNEQRSAVLAEQVLRPLGAPAGLTTEVVRLVRLTTAHDPAPDDHAGALLCDADLAVLAADGPRYAAYAADVRAEYAHVDDAAFRLGRSAVLRALLERPSLYATATGRGRWEARARANVEQELSRLAVGPDDAAPPP